MFFPPDALPGWLAGFAAALPLTHAIELARPLALGHRPDLPLLHGAVLIAYGLGGFAVGLVLTRRRLLR